MRSFVILCLVLLAGCYAGGPPKPLPQTEEPVVCAEAELPQVSTEAFFSDQDLALPGVLNLTVDSQLMEVAEASASQYQKFFGLDIVFTNYGIPVTVADEIPWGSGFADGLAHYDTPCVFDECNANHGVSIQLSTALLSTKSWALQQSLDHEIGHIITGWGISQNRDMHLPSMAGVMAPGCEGHVCAPWSMEDALFMCGSAPCSTINLPKLIVTPAAELIPFVLEVAQAYYLKTGFMIEIGENGVPIGLRDLDGNLAGQSLSTHICHGYQCNDKKYNARVWIDAEYAPRVEVSNPTALKSVIAHELGHVISGWGSCYTGSDVDASGTHLGTKGHVMSTPASPDMNWDELDNQFICSCGDCR